MDTCSNSLGIQVPSQKVIGDYYVGLEGPVVPPDKVCGSLGIPCQPHVSAWASIINSASQIRGRRPWIFNGRPPAAEGGASPQRSDVGR